MKRQYVQKLNLPDKPGVYFFRDSHRKPIYIGRATSLRDRVKSYFANDLIETRGPRIVDMVTRASTLTSQTTDSVLEAIILESQLIKKYQPKYNVGERDDKSDLYVIITDEPWPRVFTMRVRDLEQLSKQGNLAFQIKYKYGPFTQGGLINEALKILRRIFPFKDRKAYDPRHESFYKAIGRSPDAANNDSSARRNYLYTIQNLNLFLSGKSAVLQKRLEKDMRARAKEMKFEEAQEIKRMLYAMKHINDIALIKKSESIDNKAGDTSNVGKAFRMEAYDIAHLSGTNTVGTMVVSIGGLMDKAEYRKFKISREQNNDVANLVELLSRRLNHSEWTYPDLIIVDGNDVQVRAAEAVLSARRINIPVVGVTKDERHKAREVIGHPDIVKSRREQIIALNAEAHRFTIGYHRKRRAFKL